MNRLAYTEILKTNINILDMDKTVAFLDEHLEEIRGEYVCVSNVHTTVMSYRDEAYRKVQNGSVLNLPDGKPLSITQKKMGYAKAERVPGPDLMPRMFALSEEKGYRHYFYGSTQQIDTILEEKTANMNDALLDATVYLYAETEPAEAGAYGFWYWDENEKIRLW